MLHPSKRLFAAALAAGIAAGIAALPVPSRAEGSQPDKSEAASPAKKGQAANDDFEENRRLHMQKSKENNAKKGEN